MSSLAILLQYRLHDGYHCEINYESFYLNFEIRSCGGVNAKLGAKDIKEKV